MRGATVFKTLFCLLLMFAGLTVRANAQEKLVTATQRGEVVERVAKELHDNYVFTDAGDQMAALIKQRAKDGKYDSLADPKRFADALTADLRSVRNDLHLLVMYQASDGNAEGNKMSTPAKDPIERVEKLAGNVGYIKIDGLDPEMNARISEAMKELSGTDALIIDLRDNMGGAPKAAMYLAGYFFEKPTLVARIYFRPNNRTDEMWTEEVPGPLYLGKSLYILTSRSTVSAGEAFAYHLKYLGKAVTVGETTRGGAHRIMPVNVAPTFVLLVPFGRPMNVVTGGDWEGTGVVPDIKATAEKALATAHLQAIRELPSNAERQREIERLQRELGDPEK